MTPQNAQNLSVIVNEEFAGISSEVLNLNVRWVDDIDYDPITKEAIATPIADALNFRHTRFGWQTKPNLTATLFMGENGETWQAKIFGEDGQAWLNTYQNQGKRTGHYMAPKDIGDKPYLPTIPHEIARQAAAKVSPILELSLLEWFANNGLFWDWFQEHPEIPLIVTEGAKKALAAISQGYIALSLYGCNCGAKDLTVKPELLPYVQNRPIIIGFDHDIKPETRYKVFKATKRLATAIFVHAKGQPAIASWNANDGKGLDDLIAHDPQLFHTAIETAQSFEKWKFSQYSDLSHYNPLKVNTRYLEMTLPDSARLIALKSPKGTGKTEWIAKQVSQAIASGIPIIVLSHREQLVKELTNRFGVAYRTELKELGEGKQFGYGLCIDSLHPKANPPFSPESWEGCWVILDECEQVFWHLLNSNTCQYNRVAILETLTELFNCADKIFVADADLSKVSLDYLTRLLDEPVIPWLVINEWKPTTPRRAFVYNAPEGLLSDLLESIRNGDRVIVHTGAQKVSSRWGTINLESLIKKAFPSLKILRIDAESVATLGHSAYGCMGNLNAVLPLYDVVIASPTIETGVSIDIKHFHRVFGFANGTQTVGAVCQTLERVRDDIPRHIWINKYSNQRIGNGSHDPGRLLKSQEKLFKANFHFLGQLDAIADFDDKTPQHLRTWTILSALHNYGFKNYRTMILEQLQEEGYLLVDVVEPDNQQEIKQEVKAIAEANYHAHCEQVCDSPTLNDLDYHKVKDKRAKTDVERLSEKKTAIAKRYLTEDVTPDLVKADDQGLYGQLQLHYYLTVGNSYLKRRDTQKAAKLSHENKVFTPDFNHAALSAKVRAMQAVNIEQFLDGDRLFTSESLQEWFDGLLSCRQDVKLYLNQTIHPDKDTPIGVAQRLLGTIGLKLTCVERRRVKGKITRFYQMTDLNPNDRANIFARWLERDMVLCDIPSIKEFRTGT
jgi:hypothetical protein